MTTTTDHVAAKLLDSGMRWPDGAPRMRGGTHETTEAVTVGLLRDREVVETIEIPAGTVMLYPPQPQHHNVTVWLRGAWTDGLVTTSDGVVPWRWRPPGNHAYAYAVHVHWDRVHGACRALDEARSGTVLGVLPGGVGDIFGGSYSGSHYEERGLDGLVALTVSAGVAAHNAWDAIHGARSRREDSPLTGAAIRTALAVHHLRAELATAGVIAYDPRAVICGVTDGRLNVTGLYWLAGYMREPEQAPSVAAAMAYLEGGVPALRTALEADAATAEVR